MYKLRQNNLGNFLQLHNYTTTTTLQLPTTQHNLTTTKLTTR